MLEGFLNILMLVLWGIYIILTWTFSWKKNDKFPEMLEILQHCNEEYVPNNDDMSKRVIFFRVFIITSIAGKNLWNKK